MKIYKITMVIQERKRNGRIVDVDKKESVVIDNIETAKRILAEYKSQAAYSFQFATYFGTVALFEPRILADGILAYWCDEPIEIFRKDG